MDVLPRWAEIALVPLISLFLALALSMLQLETVRSRLDDAEDVPEGGAALAEELGGLLPALAAVRDALPDLAELRMELTVLSEVGGLISDADDEKTFGRAIREHARQLVQLLEQIRGKVQGHPYPFEHADADIGIGDWALPKISAKDDVNSLFGESATVDERLTSLYFRMLARVSWALERVEEVFGMQPMPAPKAG